jgi:hypothetical protein
MRSTFSSVLAAALVVSAAGCDQPTQPEESTLITPESAATTGIRITNLSVRTGRVYKVMNGALAAGATAYVDRTTTISSPVATSLQQATYIETAAADRNAYPGSNNLMTFNVDRDADVFVAHDKRTALPKWLTYFRATGLDLVVGTVHMSVFSRRFAAGPVRLGSNVAAPENERMYLVIVQPAATSAPPPSGGTPQHAGWYVAVNGSSSNAGTMERPWSLSYALSQPSGVGPGDTIWVRGGTYKQYDWSTSLSGTSSAPIVIRAYPGERAAIETEGMFQIQGSDTWWWGLEWRFTWGTRTSPESGSHPTAIPGPLSTVYVTGPRTKIINCLIHDTGDGVAIWKEATDAELYGSLIWYTGWQGPDRGHGHAIYTQNGAGLQKYRDNLAWDSYDIGVQAYGSGGVPVRNYLFQGNAFWGHSTLATSGSASQVVLGGDGEGQDIQFLDNVVYDQQALAGALRIGYNTSVSYYRYTVRDNWVVGGGPTLRVWNLFQSTFTGNTTYNPRCSDGCRMDFLGNRSGWTWSGNTHYGNAGAVDWLYDNAPKTWASWKSATGLGGSDSYLAGAPPQKVWVRPNAYEPGRATIVVVSLGGSSSAVVDLSAVGLRSGQAFEVRNAQNYFGPPVLTGTYQGGTITLPLSGLTKAPISGSAPKSPMGTGTGFNAFVVLPK